MKIQPTEAMCTITKRVINDFNSLDDQSFMNKYSCSKRLYYKRVKRYDDPYMNAPLAKIGKLLIKLKLY